jgi:hypothetical protein
MHAWRIFYFLWDDPLFNPTAEADKELLEDPESIELRRTLRLLTLELLYIQIQTLEKERAALKEGAAQMGWVCTQLLKRLLEHGVPAEVGRQVLMDARVIKHIDPEFNFAKAIGIG